MHAGAVVVEERLGHERGDLVVAARDVLDDVLVPEDLVRHRQQGVEAHVDFALAGGGHFVVVHFDRDTDLLHLDDHLAADVLQRVVRRDGEVAFLEARLIAQVRVFLATGVPRTLDAVDVVVAGVLVLAEADVVEDEELQLRADEDGVGFSDAARLNVLFRLAGNKPGIASVRLPAQRVHDVADEGQRGQFHDRVDASG